MLPCCVLAHGDRNIIEAGGSPYSIVYSPDEHQVLDDPAVGAEGSDESSARNTAARGQSDNSTAGSHGDIIWWRVKRN